MTSQPIIISIDGNIGSGKSTIVEYLKNNIYKINNRNLKIYFLEEPVSVWESIIDKNDGKNIIEKFYENNEKYAFTFQMIAYISRLSKLKKIINNNYDIIITERSIFTDRNVFAKMLYDNKSINEIEYIAYNKWFDEFSEIVDSIKYIYIKTTPEVSKNRVDHRSRKGETISLDYLKKCHEYHEKWLNTINFNSILIIDGNLDNNYTNQLIVMERIYNFISYLIKYNDMLKYRNAFTNCHNNLL